MEDRIATTSGQLVTQLDAALLASVAVSDVRPSDVAPYPTLEFSYRQRLYRLVRDQGVSTLLDVSAAGVPLCVFVYSSSLSTMRFQLDGWPSESLRLPPRRAVAYMTAMQIAAEAEARLLFDLLER